MPSAKSARNEQFKLTASLLNGVAISLLGGTAVTLLMRWSATAQAVLVIVVAVSAIAAALHLLARRVLTSIE